MMLQKEKISYPSHFLTSNSMPSTKRSSSSRSVASEGGESKGRRFSSRLEANARAKALADARNATRMDKEALAMASSSSSSVTRVSSRRKNPTRKSLASNASASSTSRKRTMKRKRGNSNSKEEEMNQTLKKGRRKKRQRMKDIDDEDDNELFAENPRSRARIPRRVSTTEASKTARQNVPEVASATNSTRSRTRTSAVISKSNVQDMTPVEKKPRYSPIDDVWGSKPIKIADINRFDEKVFFRKVTAANSIRERRGAPLADTIVPTGELAYNATLENIGDVGDAASSVDGSSVRTAVKNAVFPTDIIGRRAGPIAHLIPHGRTSVLSYWFVIPFLFNTPAAHGLGDGTARWTRNQCSRLLNGTLSASNIKTQLPGNGNTTTKRKRLDHTGLKHLNLNKISLHGQEYDYDRDPHVIIVPIMTMKQMKDFDGTEGYEAIVVTGINTGGITDTPKDVNRRNIDIETGTYIVVNEEPPASKEELETATNLLQYMLKAILKVKNNHMSDDIDDEHQYERGQTVLPILRNANGVHVAKVGFGAPHEANRHPAPDPVLLIVKAAVNWSRRYGLALAAKPEPPEEEEEEWDELDQLAAEQYIEWRESQIKPPDNFHELAAGLGQRDAVRPDDWVDTTTASTTRNRGYQSLMPNVRALLDLE